MAFTAVTYTFSNSTTADATQVNQNYQDIIAGLSDGTKYISVNAGTFAGNVAISGNTTIGNASSDTLTVTASLASTIPIGTTNTYDIGSSTLGLRALYFGANSQTVNIKGSASMSATWTLTLPVTAGTDGYYLKTNGSGVTSWQAFTPPTIQTFTTGTAQTYTTPSNVKYIKVRMVGGGAGGYGGGAGTTGQTAGTASTFFNASAGGGAAGGTAAGPGCAGGTSSLGSGAIGTVLPGGQGGPGNQTDGGGTYNVGGDGGSSFFSGAGGGGSPGVAGGAGGANTGGGGGGGSVNGATLNSGPGGGAGGYVEMLITSSLAGTYTYTVGAGGAGGSAGTNGTAGGAGGSGYIEVTEYYS